MASNQTKTIQPKQFQFIERKSSKMVSSQATRIKTKQFQNILRNSSKMVEPASTGLRWVFRPCLTWPLLKRLPPQVNSVTTPNKKTSSIVSTYWIHYNCSFRSCDVCGWVRFIPDEGRQQHCLFVGRGPWRCGRQRTLSGWFSQTAIPQTEVLTRNESILHIFEELKLVYHQAQTDVPTSEERKHMFAQLRARTISSDW